MGTVKQTRILFQVTDLIAFRVVCEHCGGEAVHAFEQGFPDAPGRCRWCNQVWRVGQVNRLLSTVRNMLNDLGGLTELRLELDGDAAGQADGGKD